jgi:hypothetical protein
MMSTWVIRDCDAQFPASGFHVPKRAITAPLQVDRANSPHAENSDPAVSG